MSARRLELHALLETLTETVYFQAPSNTKMTYPCIVYELDDVETVFADDRPYRTTKRYQVMVIDRNPDSDIPDKVIELPMCSFSRFYVADKLNHFVYNLFF